MMKRRAAVKILGAATLGVGLGLESRARAAEAIKIATVASPTSPWGRVFKTWADAVKKKTNEEVELQFFWNATQGEESGMVGKMKDGQLDGAALTAVGLGKIHKPILALQIPGLFTTWSKLDNARNAMKGDFEKGMADAGFSLLGWGDVGAAHVMSKGFPVNTPDDFKGKKPQMWRDDPLQPILFQIIGGVTPVPLNLPEVLPNLNTDTIDIVTAPSLAAELAGWTGKLDTIVTGVAGMVIGGLVISSKRLASLSEENRNVVTDTGRTAANSLTKAVRKADDEAFGRIKGKMTAVDLSPDDQAKWDNTLKQTRDRLKQGTFSADLIDKLEHLAN